jgi:glutaredoxin
MTKVVLLTAKWCVYCPSAKALWKKLKKDYKFDYEEIDIQSEKGQELAEKFSVMAVPTTIINNKIVITGLPEESKVIGAIKSEEAKLKF